MVDDYVPALLSILRAKRISYVLDPLYFYRVSRPNSASSLKFSEVYLERVLREVEKILDGEVNEEIFKKHRLALLKLYTVMYNWGTREEKSRKIYNMRRAFLKKHNLTGGEIDSAFSGFRKNTKRMLRYGYGWYRFFEWLDKFKQRFRMRVLKRRK
jgi:hypothetical protein